MIRSDKRHIPAPFASLAMISIAASYSAALASEDAVIARWTFDQVESNCFVENGGACRDAMQGHCRVATGVRGNALRADGATTCVIRKTESAPVPGEAFTIEAWMAVQAYPWGWCPIIAQHDARAGYFFGVDARGRVALRVKLEDGGQAECVSSTTVPLIQWTHVGASFDSSSGIELFIDGQPAGRVSVSGRPAYAPQCDVLIGRSAGPEPVMFSAAWGAADQPMHFAFDGLIDEVKMHRGRLESGEIGKAFLAMRPSGPPDLKPRRLPSGARESLRFGAFYERLQYCEEWDALWRGSGPDVVVGFDFAAVRLVFWRGTSYVPCWVTEKDNWLTNEFMERGADRKNRGCSEPMSDKQAHYSHVRILENSDARAVVYWRYAPVGVDYAHAYVDEQTGWGDWAEEYHTVYPDGVAVRKVVMYSGNFQPWHEWCQSIEVLHPGQRPDDVFDADRILSVANMRGETKTFGWEEGEKSYRRPTLEGANIQITYLNSRYNPFLVLDDRSGRNDHGGSGPAIHRTGGSGWSEHSLYPWWNHWPVTQIPILERQAQAADRPSHTCTSTQYSAAWQTAPGSITKIMLCGVTDQPIEDLVPLARSWLRPPRLASDSPAYRDEGYDATQRAYRLSCREAGKPQPVRLRIEGSAESPVVNPAIIVRDWGDQQIHVLSAENRGPVRCGLHRRLTGTDAVVWVPVRSTSTVEITLEPRK